MQIFLFPMSGIWGFLGHRGNIFSVYVQSNTLPPYNPPLDVHSTNKKLIFACYNKFSLLPKFH